MLLYFFFFFSSLPFVLLFFPLSLFHFKIKDKIEFIYKKQNGECTI